MQRAGILLLPRPPQLGELCQHVGQFAGRHVAVAPAAQFVGQEFPAGATEDALHLIADQVRHLGDVFRTGLPLFLDVFDLWDLIDQGGDLLSPERCVVVRILHHDRPTKDLRHAAIHVDGTVLVGSRGCHGDDGVYAGLLCCARVKHHLRDRDAGAAEDDGQATVHFFEYRIESADSLFFSEKPELTDHHRPDDAMLAAFTAEGGYLLQILCMDLEILPVRRRQEAEDPFHLVKSCHHLSHRLSGCQKSSLGLFHSSVGSNSPGNRRLASMPSQFRSTPRPGVSGTLT